MSNDNSKTKKMEQEQVTNVTFNMGEKELSIGSFAVMDNGEIIMNPLEIGNVEVHQCVLDGEKAERIMPDGTIIKADNKKFKEIAEKVKKQKEMEI